MSCPICTKPIGPDDKIWVDTANQRFYHIECWVGRKSDPRDIRIERLEKERNDLIRKLEETNNELGRVVSSGEPIDPLFRRYKNGDD